MICLQTHHQLSSIVSNLHHKNQIQWHHRVPTQEEYAIALIELEEAEKELEKPNGQL